MKKETKEAREKKIENRGRRDKAENTDKRRVREKLTEESDRRT